jgi:hypothetical protein
MTLISPTASLPCPQELGLTMARGAAFIPEPLYSERISHVIAEIGQSLTVAGALANQSEIDVWIAEVRACALAEVRRLTNPATRLPPGAA